MQSLPDLQQARIIMHCRRRPGRRKIVEELLQQHGDTITLHCSQLHQGWLCLAAGAPQGPRRGLAADGLAGTGGLQRQWGTINQLHCNQLHGGVVASGLQARDRLQGQL